MKTNPCRLTVETIEDRSVPSTVAYGDFNGDGLADMAAVTNSTTITISLANANGTYTPVATLTAPQNQPVTGVLVDDFDNDGNLDIRTGGSSGNFRFYSHSWYGYGDGTFSKRDTDQGRFTGKGF
jgi:hypothetical protein